MGRQDGVEEPVGPEELYGAGVEGLAARLRAGKDPRDFFSGRAFNLF